MLNRRHFIFTGFAAAAMPVEALADRRAPKAIGVFYHDVTQQAYRDVYATVLAGAQVMDAASLKTAIEQHWPAYKDALVRHAGALLQAAAPEVRAELAKEIAQSHRQRNGFLGPLKSDARNYVHQNGAYFRENAPTARTGNEPTNPLFLAIHDLALKGTISREQERGFIAYLEEATYTPAIYDAFNDAVKNLPAAPVPGAGDVLRLELK